MLLALASILARRERSIKETNALRLEVREVDGFGGALCRRHCSAQISGTVKVYLARAPISHTTALPTTTHDDLRPPLRLPAAGGHPPHQHLRQATHQRHRNVSPPPLSQLSTNSPTQLWHLFTLLPTSQSHSTSNLSALRRDVVRLNRDMTATSAQDEFSKWAKLRRQHDKAKDKYDALARDQQSFRTNFDRIVSVLRWLGTQGLNFFCNAYFSAQPMFWLPRGWVPYAAEWVLSFPRAPVGSISINVWGIACASVIGMVTQGAVGVWTLRSGEVKVGPTAGEKIRLEKLGGMDGGGGGGREKKEL